jgi:hypothetical protein
MKTGFQIQVACHNYETGNTTYNNEVVLTDLEKFKDLIKAINTQSKTTWNWFDRLPDKWNGERYVRDYWMINRKMKENFGQEFDAHLVEEFYKRFTPRGGDRIESVKLYKVEEIEL